MCYECDCEPHMNHNETYWAAFESNLKHLSEGHSPLGIMKMWCDSLRTLGDNPFEAAESVWATINDDIKKALQGVTVELEPEP